MEREEHICGYCQSYLNRPADVPMTLVDLGEIETRLSQGWCLKGDMTDLIAHVKRNLNGND
jgi:hypothetical protein